MAVYVDDMYRHPMGAFGRMKMSHMIADTDDELHTMANRIGIARRWHQAPPKHDSHYDIAMNKRALAIQFGAREITLRELSIMVAHRRKTGALPAPDAVPELIEEMSRRVRERMANA